MAILKDTTVEGNLISEGTDQTDGNSVIDGTLNVKSAVDFDNNLNVDGTAQIDGNSVIDGTLNVKGAVDFDSNLNCDGNGVIDGTLNVKSAADFDSNLNVDGTATIAGGSPAQYRICRQQSSTSGLLQWVDFAVYDTNGSTRLF